MRLRPCLILFLTFGAGLGRTAAQDQQVDLHQAFLDLRSDAVVMDLSAHPDDEDGASLALYRLKFGVTTFSVLFTRGEGGQNEKGPELYEELGMIRSHETRAAGAILGTRVEFLNFKDFGFSKTATEAIRIWGGQTEALRRLVYVIRKYKPDVLFTNHNTIDGHGQHQAVAVTAIAAFDAAADPSMFPEQLREPGLSLWQPRKLFFRAFGRAEGTADVSNAINDIDSVRGVSYLDIAAQALRQHRTQGMDRANLRGFTRGKSLYKLMRTNSLYEQDSTSFLSGIDFRRDTAVARLQPLRVLVMAVHPGIGSDSLLTVTGRFEQAADSLTTCCRLSPLALRIMDHWRDALHRVTMLTCGIAVTAALADTLLVPGQRVDARVAVSSSRCRVSGARWRFAAPAGWSAVERTEAAPQDGGNSRLFTLRAADDALPTVPEVEMQYRSLERHQDLQAVVACLVDGRPVTLSAPVRFEVAPLQTIAASPQQTGIIRGRTPGPLTIRYEIRNWQPRPVSGTVALES
ncbi:MAG TPA: PIG-L family deacetylase, partial [Bacteroidota bacterium]